MTGRIRDYQLRGMVGAGGEGRVWKAIDLRNQRTVALKCFSEAAIAPDVEAEFTLLERLRGCENIVEYYEYFLHDDGNYYIASEWVGGGELFELITPNIGLADTEYCRHLFRNILRGVIFCHSKGIAHRDLKPENLMLTDDGLVAKIIDFGFAKMFRNNDRHYAMTTRKGTEYYAAPEVFINGSYTYAADIWSLGVILFAMVSGSFPVKRATPEFREFRELQAGRYTYSPWPRIEADNPAVYSLLKGMLTVNVEERCTLRDVWYSSYVQGSPQDPFPTQPYFTPVWELRRTPSAASLFGNSEVTRESTIGNSSDPAQASTHSLSVSSTFKRMKLQSSVTTDVPLRSTSCGCKMGCGTRRCSCRMAGLQCQATCRCLNCVNTTTPNAASTRSVASSREATPMTAQSLKVECGSTIPSELEMTPLLATVRSIDHSQSYQRRRHLANSAQQVHANSQVAADSLLQKMSDWLGSQGARTIMNAPGGAINAALSSDYGEVQMSCVIEVGDNSDYTVKCIRRWGPILEFHRIRDQLIQHCAQ
jgi:serine/threonine protein kinase